VLMLWPVSISASVNNQTTPRTMADDYCLLGDGTQRYHIHLKCGFAQCTLEPGERHTLT
jgi:hypothetical protein